MFRIPEDKVSPSHWQSVAGILKEGVGMSTLPCVKLRAIVDAAREISRLYEREHGQSALLGADEFLPVFIFCVVRAEMERPCALSKSCDLQHIQLFAISSSTAILTLLEPFASANNDESRALLGILLNTLCDRINRIGEIGYILASFEGAIMHIQEIDLSEDREEMLSFLTVPLSEVSLNDG